MLSKITKINWVVRVKNPVFWLSVLLSIMTPVLSYFGQSFSDMVSWSVLGSMMLKAILNPYVVGLILVSLYNTIIDPTTPGITDSHNVLLYDKPVDKE